MSDKWDSDDDFEPDCECVQTDADEWSARWCPLHGPDSKMAKEQNAQEAAEEAKYWQGMKEF